MGCSGPLRPLFLWAATTLFGQSPEGAAELYQRYIRNNKQEILTLGTMLLMLIAFYLAMGRFTRWLDDIRSATRRLVEAQAEPVELPPELAPIQERSERHPAAAPGAGGGGQEASGARGIWWPSWPTISRPLLTSVVGYLTPAGTTPAWTPPSGPSSPASPWTRPGGWRSCWGSFSTSPGWIWTAGRGAPAHPAVHAAGAARRRVLPLFAEKQPGARWKFSTT